MRVLLLSDTHGYIDDRMIQYARGVDEIWHAGDFGTAVADQLEKHAPLRGVYGNIDGRDIRTQFPENELFVANGLKVLMTHIGGYPPKYNARTKKLLQLHQPKLFICGHSHILKVMPDKQHGLVHMNPGAAGKHGFHKIRTMLAFSIHNGKLSDLNAIELGLRSAL